MAENEILEIKYRLDQLERRLEDHFEALNEAIDQRDKFALNAAWGIVRSISAVVALVGVPLACKEWFGLEGWWLAIVGTVAALAVLIWFNEGNLSAEKKDAGKLWRLPAWAKEKNRFYD
ncbi:hypothetical protein [Sphingopyxis sp. H115]|uniref:hypothetical protein n=1 Tax=Sphingopyxis sp. H115 TaxID=1759073 RepID=UPI0007363D80|nr:hypothetical protein [Sphingopyxis sp. H115]KTE17028.1 hypothetical protein ATE71_03305 [Sphingopyxis sp. H115]